MNRLPFKTGEVCKQLPLRQCVQDSVVAAVRQVQVGGVPNALLRKEVDYSAQLAGESELAVKVSASTFWLRLEE